MTRRRSNAIAASIATPPSRATLRALMCALDFFGPDHMVFATDTPYDNEFGERVYRETIPAVEAMPVQPP